MDKDPESEPQPMVEDLGIESELEPLDENPEKEPLPHDGDLAAGDLSADPPTTSGDGQVGLGLFPDVCY
jgi:hypothetical protein